MTTRSPFAEWFRKTKEEKEERREESVKPWSESQKWKWRPFPSVEVCGHVDGTTNDATRMIQPHVARACCAVVGPNKKKANLARPVEGPRPLVTFPILLGTPLPGQSRRPRGTPCAAFPSSTPASLCSLFSFSSGTRCSAVSMLFLRLYLWSSIFRR